MIYEIKVGIEDLEQVIKRNKTYIVLKNDNYKVGDVVVLIYPESNRRISKKISCMDTDDQPGISAGYVILGLNSINS